MNSKFILNDVELLKEVYPVKVRDVKIFSNLFILFTLLKEFFVLLFTIWRYKIVYIWFADYHSFLPVFFAKIFAVKSVICAGGYECTYIPELNAGVFTKKTLSRRIRQFFVKFSLNNCTIILTVDDSLIRNTNTYIYSDIPAKAPLEDGIKFFIPSLKAQIKTIPLGYDPGYFKKDTGTQKEHSVITAGLIVNESEFRRKGIDLLIEASKVMKNVKFVFIGLNDEYYEKLSLMNIQNIELHKKVSYNELTEQYSKAKVFAQISMFEGMPSTICEAMLCECIPVGSNVNGIPNIVGDSGYIVFKKNLEEVMNKLYLALNSPDEAAKKARQQIITNFPIDKRKNILLKTLEEL